MGLEVRTLITDGSQPIGRGVGPALEARDVLAVLRREAEAPQDLRERSLDLAGAAIELVEDGARAACASAARVSSSPPASTTRDKALSDQSAISSTASPRNSRRSLCSVACSAAYER